MPAEPNSRALPCSLGKRSIDLACCLAALPLLALATIVLAIHNSLCSPGPLFFQQTRVGYGGRRFKLYKFRTMEATAPAAPHEMHFAELVRRNARMDKLDSRGDARLIRGGWLLRCSGLDELPQIVNVLKGEMSIVGPRPCIPYEFDQYTAAQRERFGCLPGLTGLWQVSGKNRTTFEQMIQLDVEYVRHNSASLDIEIILKTVPALCRQFVDVQKARRELHGETTLRPASHPAQS
ncbi:MAG: sugar transferase [Opitutus sp.]